MAKDPAFLFYPGDWTLGTMHLTLLEKGCYMELLILQFAKGKFTEAQAKHMLNGSFTVAWANIRDKFETDGTFYWNKRLQVEKEKRQKFTESRRNNGSIPKVDKKDDKHMHKHMEDENENTNKLWFLRYYHSTYENYKSVFNGQSTTENYFNQWKKLIDFIYENKYESLFDAKFVSPHSFEILVKKEKFTEDVWDETIKKILATGIKPEHDLFFRIPEFMKYSKKDNGKSTPSTVGKEIKFDRP